LTVLWTGGGRRANYARNLGGRTATTDYVSLLDDDDEWLPEKIEKQIRLAGELEQRGLLPVVATRSRVLLPRGTAIWPEVLPQSQLSLAEYLLKPSVLRPGRRVVHTSMLLMPRRVFDLIEFDEDLPRMQEWDFLIRFSQLATACVAAHPDVLTVWHCEETSGRTSTRNDWRTSRAWIESLRPQIGDRLSDTVVATFIMAIAVQQRGRPEGLRVLRSVRLSKVELTAWPQILFLLTKPRGGSSLHGLFGLMHHRVLSRQGATSARPGTSSRGVTALTVTPDQAADPR
jgi:glycosyltransferase involved in cell wall biosynthesis